MGKVSYNRTVDDTKLTDVREVLSRLWIRRYVFTILGNPLLFLYYRETGVPTLIVENFYDRFRKNKKTKSGTLLYRT